MNDMNAKLGNQPLEQSRINDACGKCEDIRHRLRNNCERLERKLDMLNGPTPSAVDATQDETPGGTLNSLHNEIDTINKLTDRLTASVERIESV